MHPLLERLGLTSPIVQAPMAGTSTPELAAAVSNAGALGSIAIGHIDGETAAADIARLRSATNRAFNVNLFCHAPAARDLDVENAWLGRLAPIFQTYGARPPAALNEIYTSFLSDPAPLELLLRTRPAVVSLHFGLPPTETITALKRAGSTVFATATSVAEGEAAARAGVDAVVAQGFEAGGHRGIFDPNGPDEQLGVFALTHRLAVALDIPVIAAGGVMDGAGIAAARALGAIAVQMGTAFIACPEARPDPAHLAALLASRTSRTLMTRAISGRPARCLANRFTDLEAGLGTPPAYPVAYDSGKALNAAAKSGGEGGYGAWWAGQCAQLIRPMPAARLVGLLSEELRAAAAHV